MHHAEHMWHMNTHIVLVHGPFDRPVCIYSKLSNHWTLCDWSFSLQLYNVKLSSSPEPSELWKLSNYLLLCGPIPSVHLCFLSLIHFVSSRTPAACFSLRPVHHLWVSPVLLILHHFISLSLCMLTHAHWIGCQGVMHYCFHGNRMAVSPCYRSRHSTF